MVCVDDVEPSPVVVEPYIDCFVDKLRQSSRLDHFLTVAAPPAQFITPS